MKKVLLAVCLTFALAAPAFSQPMDMPMKGSMGGKGHMMNMGNMEKLGDMMGMCIEHSDMMGLTDDQIHKIKALHIDMAKKQARFVADLKIAEIELREIMDVKDFSLEKANDAVKKIGGIKIVHHLEMLKAAKEMRSILTDEQFKKMRKMMPMMGMKKPAKKKMMKK